MFNNQLTIFIAILLSVILVSLQTQAAASDDFVITVKTDNPGTTSDTQFTIPTYGFGYNYSVDCDNDSNNEATGITGNYICNYPVAGTYTIRIKHNNATGLGFPRIYFANQKDKLKIISLDQWGTSKWTNMGYAFSGCENMYVLASDIPDLTNLTSLSNMFRNAKLANPETTNWNVSFVKNMDYLFYGATSANPNTSNWITLNVTNMSYMFAYAIKANPDTSNWITSKVTTMWGMFRDNPVANPDTSQWDTSSVTTLGDMFIRSYSANPDTSLWDISNISYMGYFLYDVTLPMHSYEDLLVGFNAQTLQSNVPFHGGNSQYCSTAAQTARANMIASDGWSITDGGICAPQTPADLLMSSDSGSDSADNITQDNTPDIEVACSFIGNVMKIYSSNTLLATQTCTSLGNATINIAGVLADGVHQISYSQTDAQGESSRSTTLAVTIDTQVNAPFCSTSPSLASDNISVTTTCTGVEAGASLSIANMLCSLVSSGMEDTYACTGTVGTGMGQINQANDTVTVQDIAGNSNSMANTGLNINFNAVASADNFTVVEDSNVSPFNVLSNDNDAEGDNFVIEAVTQPNNGVVTFQDNSLSYLPNADYCNNGISTDNFTYTITGGSQAQVSVTVDCINDAPSFAVVCDFDASDFIGASNNLFQLQIQDISMGPDNELGQQVQSFNLSLDDPDAIFNQVSIDNNGLIQLDFSLVTGVATVGVSLTDNGGTTAGGINTSDEQLFQVVYTNSGVIEGLIYRDSFERACDFIQNIP